MRYSEADGQMMLATKFRPARFMNYFILSRFGPGAAALRTHVVRRMLTLKKMKR